MLQLKQCNLFIDSPCISRQTAIRAYYTYFFAGDRHWMLLSPMEYRRSLGIA